MVIEQNYYIFIGLVFDFFGAIALAYDLIISRKEAIELSVPRVGGETEKENLELPQVRDRLKQSHNAKIGVILLVIGFLLQIVGNWPTAAP